ncbi:protein PIGMENT DEFECTIVE [Salix suchowensis]|nr:protein PIGMENT DEFECTIVE [Salix suchowensis]
MQTLLQPCKSLTIFSSSLPPHSNILVITQSSINPPLWRNSHISLCSQNDAFDDFSNTQLPEKAQDDIIQDNEELELLNKPSPMFFNNGLDVEAVKESEKPDKDEALAPFLKFFKSNNSLDGMCEDEDDLGVVEERSDVDNEDKEARKINVDYYNPKPGDFVVGVVVSGNENKLDEVLPLYDKEFEFLLCDTKKDAKEFMVKGKMGIVKDEVAMSRGPPGLGKPVVETGTVLFSEVLGRTLSGRPLLSTRRLFRRIAWQRVRQIKDLNEPIEIEISEWNTGGLLTRIEGLRAFLPKAELLNRVNNFKELKENVGRRIYILINRINESNNELVLSERKAWEMINLREGTLLEGTVKKLFPYGAQVRIGETNRSGLLHVSNITRTRVSSVSDLLKVDEKVKVLVVKSMFPDKISLSIADLESEPGLFVLNKEKVFAEAEEMAKKYQQKLPASSANLKPEIPPSKNTQSSDIEAALYANWKWFKFERE